MKRELPSVNYLMQCFSIDEIGWRLIRIKRPAWHFKNSKVKQGWEQMIGTECSGRNNGELIVSLDGKTYLQKHIIFKIVTGRTAQVLFYKDGNKDNLNPNNLVESTKRDYWRNEFGVYKKTNKATSRNCGQRGMRCNDR